MKTSPRVRTRSHANHSQAGALPLSGWVTQTKTEWSEMVHLIPDGVSFRMSNICPKVQQQRRPGDRSPPGSGSWTDLPHTQRPVRPVTAGKSCFFSPFLLIRSWCSQSHFNTTEPLLMWGTSVRCGKKDLLDLLYCGFPMCQWHDSELIVGDIQVRLIPGSQRKPWPCSLAGVRSIDLDVQPSMNWQLEDLLCATELVQLRFMKL